MTEHTAARCKALLPRESRGVPPDHSSGVYIWLAAMSPSAVPRQTWGHLGRRKKGGRRPETRDAGGIQTDRVQLGRAKIFLARRMPEPPGDGQYAQNEGEGCEHSHRLAQERGGDLDRLLQVPGQPEAGGRLDPCQRAWVALEGEGGIGCSNWACLQLVFLGM